MDKFHYLKKAGKIAKRALDFAESLAKPETTLLEIAEKTEQYILDQGGYLAFPVNLSLNNIAAHYTPKPNDKTILKEGDVLKIDLGVHIEGWIVDVAKTIEINDNKYKNLIKACEESLNNVKKILKKGITLNDIGKTIEETITSYGFKPIYNLSGHEIAQYNLHAGLIIPNYANNSTKKIKDGVYAIEPFATDGVGYIKDAEQSSIYIIKKECNIRIPQVKKFYDFIKSKYKTLPFAKRWLLKNFNDISKINNFIEILKKHNIIYEYPILVEKSDGIVVQFETTFNVNSEVCDLTE